VVVHFVDHHCFKFLFKIIFLIAKVQICTCWAWFSHIFVKIILLFCYIYYYSLFSLFVLLVIHMPFVFNNTYKNEALKCSFPSDRWNSEKLLVRFILSTSTCSIVGYILKGSINCVSLHLLIL
jgi:hypothetical protein